MKKPKDIDFMLAQLVWTPLRRLKEYTDDYKKLNTANPKGVEKFFKRWKMRVPLAEMTIASAV